MVQYLKNKNSGTCTIKTKNLKLDYKKQKVLQDINIKEEITMRKFLNGGMLW